jgi:hypothetical protein
MDVSIRQLRSTARQLARGKHRSGIRYPASFRDAVITLARTRVAHGQSRAQVARAVGVSFPTLAAWLQRPGPMAVRPVAIVPESASAPERPSRMVLVTPQGFRIEGLDRDTLVAVLRALP